MFPSRQGGTLKPEKRESRTMSWHGVYSRMHDDARSKPFRNRAQIVVSRERPFAALANCLSDIVAILARNRSPA